ncbi:hypothetical protein FHR32_006875 [Streptosporangium album]|uniref:Uncharacterized protein n=1 Tax=Streptosporangium album TaxID=47479 RepID=A0A7W7S229_9ACTN|nr:hypothetical protein [Streptosporangium album]MBB4942489.1 hypothetical protein [Streptosporangium album]
MPAEVKAAMLLMWLQSVLGAVMVCFTLAVLVMGGLPSLDAVPWFFHLFFVSLVLMGPLSALFGLRWRWAWKAAAVVEGISVLEYGYGTFAMFGVFSIAAVGLGLAVLVLFLLFRDDTPRWFER